MTMAIGRRSLQERENKGRLEMKPRLGGVWETGLPASVLSVKGLPESALKFAFFLFFY